MAGQLRHPFAGGWCHITLPGRSSRMTAIPLPLIGLRSWRGPGRPSLPFRHRVVAATRRGGRLGRSTGGIGKANDPDAIGYGGYPITTHDRGGSFTPKGGYVRPEPPLYSIPFRSLYSVNVPNLLMCGRCASMTHRALGSTRVQSTCAVTGQAAGLAAANCVKTGLTPRAYGQKHIRDLQRELKANGQKILGMNV